MLNEYAVSQRHEFLSLAQQLVSYDTPGQDKVRCDALADLMATQLAPLGEVSRITNPHGGDHLRLHIPASGTTTEEAAVLILCHYDTVWPVGTAAMRPLQVMGDTAFGAGLYDMKASIALSMLALRGIGELGLRLRRPVTWLITSDEEIGSPASRELIEREARSAAQVLVLEPPIEQGSLLKTARKGVGVYNLAITGRAAHAGVEPEKGINALTELAHQILAVEALANHAQGTTVNVGVAQGGSASNVVPAAATMEIDVRVWSAAEADRLEAGFRALRPVLPGAQLLLTGGLNRPPMERTPASIALFKRTQVIGAELGLSLGEGATGGASDGNFTSALGIPTIDGLGAPGQGAHAMHEQINIPRALQRLALLMGLLTQL